MLTLLALALLLAPQLPAPAMPPADDATAHSPPQRLKWWTPRTQVRELKRMAARMERRYRLPRGLVVAVVYHESRGRRRALRMNRNGSCDVGPGQINVPGCDPLRVGQLLDVAYNISEAARILRASEVACLRRPGRLGCSECVWGRYNPWSRRWCGRVLQIWEAYYAR